MAKRISVYPLAFLLFILVFPKTVYSHHQTQVLGASTSSAAPQIPPTAEGPGLILPDSPLFFLDEIKQQVRLLLAFTPEDKAKVHNAVSGERLAELRFMLNRQNQRGIDTALLGMTQNLKDASNNLATAQFKGKNVSKIAKAINEDIKRKQEALDLLENQSTGELNAMVRFAQLSILESKVKIEDALPEDELENEISYDLNRQIEKRVEDASDLARALMRDLDELEKQESEAAQKSLTNREEALEKAIEKKSEALRKVEEKLLENEKRKQDSLLKVQEKVAEQAQEAVKKAQEAALNYQKLQEEVNKIKTLNP